MKTKRRLVYLLQRSAEKRKTRQRYGEKRGLNAAVKCAKRLTQKAKKFGSFICEFVFL